MKAKFTMTREQSIFVAKRNIVDYIWKSAKLEGLGVTYPDTEAIFNGIGVENIPVNEIIAVNNLKRSWQFIMNNLDYPVDYAFVCKINRIVGGDNLFYGSGYIRKIPVSIGGTTWKPILPDEYEIKKELSDIGLLSYETERAIITMLYLMRRQMFLDGNKRTAMLSANQIMIAAGCGIISIPIEKQRNFTKLLIEFYETDNMEEIKKFVYEECIDGMDFSEM